MDAREERGASADLSDERGREMWSLWTRFCKESKTLGIEGLCTVAATLFHPVQPTVDELHSFTLLNYNIIEDRLPFGLFITGGYRCVPDEEINYTLDTPEIHFLGAALYGKRLIITGNLGHSTGRRMMGELINRGSVLACFGAGMIGTLVNNGTTTTDTAVCMTGLYDDPKNHVPVSGLLGSDNGRWNIQPELQASFREAITNPHHLSHGDLDEKLHAEYGMVNR
jgi:hypothetical protein